MSRLRPSPRLHRCLSLFALGGVLACGGGEDSAPELDEDDRPVEEQPADGGVGPGDDASSEQLPGDAGATDSEDLPVFRMSVETLGVAPNGMPWSCDTLGVNEVVTYLQEVGNYENGGTTYASCDLPEIGEPGELPARGEYFYQVELRWFEFTRAMLSGKFVYDKEDVDLKVRFTFHTIPVDYTIMQDGVEKTCAEVGAAKIQLTYATMGRSISANMRCSDISSTILYPVAPGTYEFSAALLDSSDEPMATWQAEQEVTVGEAEPGTLPAPHFELTASMPPAP